MVVKREKMEMLVTFVIVKKKMVWKNYKIQDYKIMRYKAIPEIIRFPVN